MKKFKGKKLAVLALAGILSAALLTGCGGEGGGGQQASTIEFDKNLIYKANYYNKPEELEYLGNLIAGQDGKIYAQGYSSKEQKDMIAQINPETGVAEKFFPNENPVENSWLVSFSVDAEGNFWKIFSIYVPNETNPEQGGNKYLVQQVTPEGKELKSVELKTKENNFYPNSMLFDDAGNMFLSGSNAFLVYDKEGNEIMNHPVTTYIESMVKDNNGTVYITYSSEDYKERIISKVDVAAKQLTEVRKVEGATALNLLSGKDGIYLNDNVFLYSYNMETGEKTKVLNWINSDINGSQTYGLIGLPDGRFICSVYDELSQQNQVMIAEKVPAEEVKDKKLVSLAMPYNDYFINTAVVAFNKQNEEYRVVVDDYSEYATAENYNAGAEKMNTDLISGKVPDLISVGSLPIANYTNKGLFADLYEKMDADSEFNRSDYMENIFKAYEKDGKLYSLAPSFYVQTVIGKESNVGKTPGWTMDDLEKLMASKPEGTKSFSNEVQTSILNKGLFLGIDQYINYTESTCNFENEEFIKLLNFAKQFPKEYQNDDMSRPGMESSTFVGGMMPEENDNPFATDKVMLQSYFLYDYDQIHMDKYYNYGGSELTFIGFPTANKQGSAISGSMEIAMSSKAAYPDGAWAFIKYLLGDEYQGSKRYEWPVKKSMYPKLKEKAQTPDTYIDADGKEHIMENTVVIDGKEVKIGRVSDEDVKKVDELLNSITQVIRYDTKVQEIIEEESGAFFSDQKPAEEVAKLIQNRVQTYLSESN